MSVIVDYINPPARHGQTKKRAKKRSLVIPVLLSLTCDSGNVIPPALLLARQVPRGFSRPVDRRIMILLGTEAICQICLNIYIMRLECYAPPRSVKFAARGLQDAAAHVTSGVFRIARFPQLAEKWTNGGETKVIL